MPFTAIAAGAGIAGYLFYLLVQFLLVHRRRHLLKRNHGCLPPRKLSQKDPFLGTDVVLQNLRAAREYGFLQLLKSRHEANGRTYTTNTYFRTTINTCDPALIRNVLAFQFQDFGMGPLRRSSASPLLGRGIFTTDDEIWAHQRALIRPSFVRAQVTDFTIFGHHVDRLIGLIKKQNYEVDLQQLFFRMVLDSNSEYMFGESVGLMSESASDSAIMFHHALDYAQQGTILRLRLGNLMFAHRDQKFRDSCGIVHAFAQKFVDQALDFRRSQALLPPEEREKSENGDRQKYVFLAELAKDTDDPILLRDQIVNMLLAARDTTAGLLSFVFYMLARRKDVWEKTRADVLEHYCEPLTYDAVMNMTYLRYVVQETLRLFPPIATNSRMANKDTVLPVGGGPDGQSPLFVAKNNVVTYSTYVMHRRKELFGEDADEFRPERWETLRPGWEYLPFNGGPRICPGQKFALTESSYTIARLLHFFSGIQNLDMTEWREQLTLSLTLNNGVHCRLLP
ncbi:cytochrome P450 alkane hydroxylase [Penicillium capsulatum]|uniref:Cytochrome P450 alkane hydroxylase n=1 Tax=Penicillium capsulatum TaxID=69766 RepID=A0A9W9LS90_9EURO|nr:cytochrome P450 alkane hydroxylase [Penicillium capsulatum]KAJ6135139.1 cytochrome P450 alkane hydroxylase [Penicillium capsulatum]